MLAIDQAIVGDVRDVAVATMPVIGAWLIWKTSQIKKVADTTQKIADATHTLSNSAMGAQLLANVQNLEALSIFAHRLAIITSQEADLSAAKAVDVRVGSAKDEYNEHLKRQAVVDSGGKLGL